jgi:DNA-binding NtrC family response regulator
MVPMKDIVQNKKLKQNLVTRLSQSNLALQCFEQWRTDIVNLVKR